MRAWTPIALEELIATARTYNAVVTYKELALRVQDASGTRTRALITKRIGTLLEQVAILAKDRGEPAQKTVSAPEPVTCPNCFVTLPTTTVFDYCGWSLA